MNNCQVVNPVCEYEVANHSKRARKRSFNVTSHKHDAKKSLTVRNILMSSMYFSELFISYSYFITTLVMSRVFSMNIF